jgi:hypothetical protein
MKQHPTILVNRNRASLTLAFLCYPVSSHPGQQGQPGSDTEGYPALSTRFSSAHEQRFSTETDRKGEKMLGEMVEEPGLWAEWQKSLES